MIKKICMLLLLCTILCSCYTQKIILNADKKSGKIHISYELDDATLQLLSIAADTMSNDNNFDTMALSDEDIFKEMFKEAFKDIIGIRLKSVKIDTSNGYKGNIVIEFHNLEKILENLPEGITNLNIKREGLLLEMSQEIDPTTMDPEGNFKNFIEEQKEDDIDFYNMLTNEAKFTFIIKSVLPIKKAEGVKLSQDKKSAEYSFKVADILNMKEKIKFLIVL